MFNPNRILHRPFCSPGEHPITPRMMSQASTPVDHYSGSPRANHVYPPFGSPSFSPPTFNPLGNGNRFPFNIPPPPFGGPHPFVPNSPHPSLNHTNQTDPPSYHSSRPSAFRPDQTGNESFYSFPSTPSSFVSNDGRWSVPPETPQLMHNNSTSRRTQFTDSTGGFSVHRALSDPWQDLVPKRTPDGVCLVSRPVAQRHTVLFAPRDRHRKAESDVSIDAGEPLSKRASAVPSNPPDNSSLDHSTELSNAE